MQKSRLGVILVLSAAVLWSTGGLIIKQIEVDPFFINAVRTAVAGLTMAPFVKWKNVRINRYLFVYVIGYVWLTNSFVLATKLTSAANAIALQYTSPLLVFLYLVLLKKEKIRSRSLVPILLIAAGIVFYLSEPNQGNSALGNLIAITSGIATAAITLSLPQLEDYSSLMLVSLSNICTCVVLIPIIMVKGLTVSALLPGQWGYLIYLGVFQLGLAFLLFVKGVQIVSSFRGSILALMEAVLNPIWVYLFIGEIPSSYGIAGWFLVLGAVALNLVLQAAEKKNSVKPEQ